MTLLYQSLLQRIYLDSITFSASSQGETNLIYFDLNQAFDKVPRTLFFFTQTQ
jgi:hypothetical protein